MSSSVFLLKVLGSIKHQFFCFEEHSLRHLETHVSAEESPGPSIHWDKHFARHTWSLSFCSSFACTSSAFDRTAVDVIAIVVVFKEVRRGFIIEHPSLWWFLAWILDENGEDCCTEYPSISYIETKRIMAQHIHESLFTSTDWVVVVVDVIVNGRLLLFCVFCFSVGIGVTFLLLLFMWTQNLFVVFICSLIVIFKSEWMSEWVSEWAAKGSVSMMVINTKTAQFPAGIYVGFYVLWYWYHIGHH